MISSFQEQPKFGQIALYDKDRKLIEKITLFRGENIPVPHQIIPLGNKQDKAYYIGYSLPKGFVITFMNNQTSVNETGLDFIYDAQKKAGKTITLIGDDCFDNDSDTALTKFIDLKNGPRIEHQISAYFWRIADTSSGWVRLFYDANYQNNFLTFLISEMKVGKYYNITGWFLEDDISSIKAYNLPGTLQFNCYQDADGGGTALSFYDPNATYPDLSDNKLNDGISSVMIDFIKPLYEEILDQTVQIETNKDTKSSALIGTQQSHYNINDDDEQHFVFKFSDTIQTTTTLTTTKQWHVGAGVTWGYSVTEKATEGVPGDSVEESATESIKFSFNFDYTHTHTKTKSITKTNTVEFTQDVKIPPKSKLTASFYAEKNKFTAKISTKAVRWYEEEVKGSTFVTDGKHPNTFRKEDTLEGTMEGELFFKINTSYDQEDH